MIEKLYSIQETADLFAISTRGIWRLIAEGKLNKPVKVGRSSRIPQSDIEDYLTRLKKEREHA